MKIILLLLCSIGISLSVCAKDIEYIKNEESAIRVGEAFLVGIYGEQVLKQRPFKISLTKTTWILDGTFHCPKKQVCLGGVAHIEFNKKDGRIINVIHGK